MCSRKLEIKRASNILHIRVQLIDQIEHRMERPVHSGVFCIGTVSSKFLQQQLVFCDALHRFEQIGGQRQQMAFKNVIKMRKEIFKKRNFTGFSLALDKEFGLVDRVCGAQLFTRWLVLTVWLFK